jgi:uncharacterized protein with PIN domain
MEQGIEWLTKRAKQLSAARGIALSDAFTLVHDELAAKRPFQQANGDVPTFFCDSGLGGLARWLRGAGYQALWQPHIADDALVREAQNRGAVLLTTDSLLMERRVLREGTVRALWLPPTLPIRTQLKAVFREFGLHIREPRCMACGGPLLSVTKDDLRHRIPPKTYRWLDEYFVCKDCDKLFWRGTHWENIRRELDVMVRESVATK